MSIPMICEFTYVLYSLFLFFSSRRRHTSCALVTGVQTWALPISAEVRRAVRCVLRVHVRVVRYQRQLFGQLSGQPEFHAVGVGLLEVVVVAVGMRLDRPSVV